MSCIDSMALPRHRLLGGTEDNRPVPLGFTPELEAKEAVVRRPVVLLVEDDFLVATEAENVLREAGFEVLGPASSAAEAVRIALSQRPALVVMDIRLIGSRDGIDAARQIYEMTGIRSIFATAHGSSETRARTDSIAPLGWLPKPYSPESLISTVKAALGTLKS
jgi:DNA-binding NarL/FixJ family response regulator